MTTQVKQIVEVMGIKCTVGTQKHAKLVIEEQRKQKREEMLKKLFSR